MAIDTAEKRRSAAHAGKKFVGKGVTPNADKDIEWRQQAGWGYSGIPAAFPAQPLAVVYTVLAVGGATVRYAVIINDAFGNRLLVPNDWVTFELVRVENDVGALTLTLPGYYPRSLFKKDGLIEIWRQVGNGAPYLETETLWLQRRWRWTWNRTGSGVEILRRILCFDLNHLLRRRKVDYVAGSAQAAQRDEADDLLKAIAAQNLGASATDATRSWATYLDIQANATQAPVIRKAFAKRTVLDVMQEIAQSSFEAGTYLAFDLMCKSPPNQGAFKLEFRTYTGQRGVDHTFPGGNPPLLIGPEFGNLNNVEMDDDAEDEATRAIVAGSGQGAARQVARADDAGRQGESPFGLIEAYLDAFQSGTSLADEADALLRSREPRRTLTGDIEPTSGLLYGIHWNWGDLVTAQVDGESFDAHLRAVSITVDREQGERVRAFVRAEL